MNNIKIFAAYIAAAVIGAFGYFLTPKNLSIPPYFVGVSSGLLVYVVTKFVEQREDGKKVSETK